MRVFHAIKFLTIVLGAGLLSGLLVMAVVFRGNPEVQVPYLEGEEVVTALELADGAGLILKVEGLDFHEELPRNFVIKQTPPAGRTLRQGREVKVVISRGIQGVMMPDVREMSLRQAGNILSQRGLEPASIRRISSPLKEGHVIAQMPPRGAQIEKETKVELLVSSGGKQRRFLLPDLTGGDIVAATEALQSSGLKVGRIRYSATGDSIPGTVLEQDPAPGRPVLPGEEVALTVQRADSGDSDRRTYTVYNYQLPQKHSGTVRVMLENSDGERQIYLRSHRGGQTISLLVQVVGRTTIRIYLADELVEVKHF